MRKILILLCVCFSFQSISQNVGIGTASPTGKLQVNHRSSTAVGLRLVDSSGNGAGSVEFRNINNTTRMVMIGYTESGFNNGQYIDVTSDSSFVATFRGNGMVGIRTGTPQYPLHVNGDINTTGAVRVNGNAGTDGQVLSSNGDGTIAWQDLCDYKNVATFRTIGAGSWTVPAGVTKIMVEAWGAGAGGTAFCGGGGGGYISGFFTVTPGNVINFSIGDGGVGAHDNANNGQSTTVTVTGATTLTASGGNAPVYTLASLNVSGATGGGYTSSSSLFFNYYGIWGKPGSAGVNTFIQSGAATFLESISGANGGDGANSKNTAGMGAFYLHNITAGTKVRSMSVGIARQPGGGGPGGYYVTTATLFGNGQSGADGMVIIHY